MKIRREGRGEGMIMITNITAADAAVAALITFCLQVLQFSPKHISFLSSLL